MARTNAQKRQSRLEANRKLQRQRREAMAAERRPDTSRVDAALVEALSYCLGAMVGSVVASARAADTKKQPTSHILPARMITDTALTILVDREGFDRAHSKRALARRLAIRKEHLEPSYIPSLRADPAAQAARKASANSPPLPPQTVSESTE